MRCESRHFVLVAVGIAACSTVYAQSPLPISGGGTGATIASSALADLGLPIISVKDFGATGNGSTNDTTAINNAMSACVSKAVPNNGCILYFPAGIYMTTGLSISSFVNIKGDGWGTTVIRLMPNTSSDVLTVPISAFNFSIYGLTLDGNSAHGGRGNCFSTATTPESPTAWNTANKQTASITAQKWGHIEEVMFSNCSNDGIFIKVYNYLLYFDNFYAFNNGVYGIYTQGTDSLFSNFVSERNGTSGLYVNNSNNKFLNAKVIWNGFRDTSAGAIFTNGSRNIFTNIEAQDNYVSGFVDQGSDNQFIGCQADTNGYAKRNPNASSLTASGFVISGTNGVYVGDKVTSYRGRLSDGNFATQWPYTITNPRQSRIDISFDGTNQPPPTASSIPQVGSPLAGYAACIKAAGPPAVIGYCSTSISSSGACTCK